MSTNDNSWLSSCNIDYMTCCNFFMQILFWKLKIWQPCLGVALIYTLLFWSRLKKESIYGNSYRRCKKPQAAFSEIKILSEIGASFTPYYKKKRTSIKLTNNENATQTHPRALKSPCREQNKDKARTRKAIWLVDVVARHPPVRQSGERAATLYQSGRVRWREF